jgi:hypothetical protein
VRGTIVIMSKTRQVDEYVRGFCDACCLRTTGCVFKLCDTSSLGINGTEKDEIPTNQKLIRLQIITPFAVIYSTRRTHTLRSKCDNGMNELAAVSFSHHTPQRVPVRALPGRHHRTHHRRRHLPDETRRAAQHTQVQQIRSF